MLPVGRTLPEQRDIGNGYGIRRRGQSVGVRNRDRSGLLGGGGLTDEKGEFSISVPSAQSVLVFNFAGYDTQTATVGERRIIPVIMSQTSTAIEDVVVMAFATQKKESVVASITTINPSELKVPSSNMTTAFAGRMSGMIAYQRNGEPGRDNVEFFVRGVTTFGYKKDPLILIDSNESSSYDLSRMQPDDIASFSILKDATATALYGSRGANGVILVSTKGGHEGPAKINIRFEEAFSMPTSMVDFADPVTFMNLHNEAAVTRDPLAPRPYSRFKIENTVAGTNKYVFPATDWYKILFKDFSNNHRLNMNVSGGGKVARYYIAGSLVRDNGLLNVDERSNFNSNVKLNRYMLRSNVNINVTPTTEAVVRLSGSFEDYIGPVQGGSDIFREVMHTNPVLFPPYYEPDEANKNTQHILFGNYGVNNSYHNPYAGMLRGYRQSTDATVLAQFEVKQDLSAITEGLSLRAMFNTSRYSYFDVSREYAPFFYYANEATYNSENGTYRLSPLNNGTEYLGYTEGPKNVSATTYFESAAQWSRNFNDEHEVGALLVFTVRNELRGNAGSLQESLPYRNMNLAGRVSYAYGGRYLFEGNFGYNGSERFSKAYRFGFFPSAGIGWILSNEEFFGTGLKRVVNNLKLKATYGLSGNDAIGSASDRFFYLSNVNMAVDSHRSWFGSYGNSNEVGVKRGVSISRYANDAITWETAEKMNFTVEAGFWNMFELQAEYFREKRYNILMDRASIPSTMGLQAAVRSNVGRARSSGVDLSLNFNHFFNQNFWISGMSNFTYATSEFEVYEEPEYPDAPWKSHRGYSLNQRWGYIAERLFVDEEEVRNSPTQFGEYMAGDIKYKDLNGDGRITELDMAPIGYPTSPEIVYGFGLSVGYKAFDFSFFFQGLARESFWIEQRDDWNNGIVDTRPFLNGQNNILKAYADSHWSENDRNIYAMWPRLSTTGNQNNEQSSTWFMRNGAFMRLKSVELGYTLPQKIAEKVRMKDCRIYFSGTNLLTFSKFKMWDPEMGGNGLGYPVQKVLNLGVQVSF